MGTTPNGLPYPEATDDLRDGAAAIQALAVALDDAGTFGDVVPIPILSPYTGTLVSQRVGLWMVVTGDISGSMAVGALVEFADVGGVSPSPALFTSGATYLGNGYAATTFIRDDGSIGMSNRSGVAVNRARFQVSYPLPSVSAA